MPLNGCFNWNNYRPCALIAVRLLYIAATAVAMDLMEDVRRPVVHGVKLYAGGKESMVGSLCVSAFHLLYSTRRHEGKDEITVSDMHFDP